MAHYVDGFVLVVKKKNLAAYKKMAAEGGRLWKKFGALSYKECIGEDLEHKGEDTMPPVLSFLKLAGAKKDETVWFSYIVYKSRAHRDAVNKKVIAEMGKMAQKKKDMPMPFDMQRMAYGGFNAIVDL